MGWSGWSLLSKNSRSTFQFRVIFFISVQRRKTLKELNIDKSWFSLRNDKNHQRYLRHRQYKYTRYSVILGPYNLWWWSFALLPRFRVIIFRIFFRITRCSSKQWWTWRRLGWTTSRKSQTNIRSNGWKREENKVSWLWRSSKIAHDRLELRPIARNLSRSFTFI